MSWQGQWRQTVMVAQGGRFCCMAVRRHAPFRYHAFRMLPALALATLRGSGCAARQKHHFGRLVRRRSGHQLPRCTSARQRLQQRYTKFQKAESRGDYRITSTQKMRPAILRTRGSTGPTTYEVELSLPSLAAWWPGGPHREITTTRMIDILYVVFSRYL